MSNTINLSKGQLALKRATSENIPNATINEIKEFSSAGLSNQDIADHFNISEKQVLWILNPQRGKEIIDILVKHCKSDDSFLRKLVK